MARRTPAASNGRTVVAYSTVRSSPSVAARTPSSIGPTATTVPSRPSRTGMNPPVPLTGRASRFAWSERRTYTRPSPATASRNSASASSGWPGTCTVQPSSVSRRATSPGAMWVKPPAYQSYEPPALTRTPPTP